MQHNVPWGAGQPTPAASAASASAASRAADTQEAILRELKVHSIQLAMATDTEEPARIRADPSLAGH